MFNIKLVIAYFGVSYAGWQKTKMGPSIEEVLEQTLARILQHEVKLQAASRTDAGVHAHAQVVNFIAQKPLDLNRLKYSLNGMLPKEIAILEAVEMPFDFHPTLDTIGKEYWYQICNSPTQLPFHRQTSWHFPYPLDLDQMRLAASHLLGTHDFSSFCNDRKLWDRNPVCRLEKIEITPLPGQRFNIALLGDHFLFRMARNLAGTLAYAGCGKLKPRELSSILESKDRTLAGVTAPAHGLTLKQVFY
ncbi:MAG: tRNA pseudouridine(38-40) synthase TruA [Verrucomicrobia bacterium]|nr:tRNA pseudouridine(38-40) synthase TruA [Verrucomicrobiota bacterium]